MQINEGRQSEHLAVPYQEVKEIKQNVMYQKPERKNEPMIS